MDKQQLLNKIRAILDGIDRTETDGGGWWETSTGAAFGAEVLRKIEDAFAAISGLEMQYPIPREGWLQV